MSTANCMRGRSPSSLSTQTFRRSPFISQHQHLWAIALISQHPNLSAIALISQHLHLSAIAPRHLSEPRTTDPNL
ncbi:hypothetical protein [Thermoleptolyngbya sp. C42_A2020_037]|uniref:hypothetical protein n=1 Tax=Thermoleptolyngbya sp. C42_A2020_037 TaxID=2747799 RepID=UPI001A0C830F|nr:hypothetical protein [Thermoleptolyngbya sp. C42_A2020_037]MBF2085650.1 hypothetical protein [Thermoleptolyngbya sp. C42_A2020_037]